MRRQLLTFDYLCSAFAAFVALAYWRVNSEEFISSINEKLSGQYDVVKSNVSFQISGKIETTKTFRVKKTMWHSVSELENIANIPENDSLIRSRVESVNEYNLERNPNYLVQSTIGVDQDGDGLAGDLTFREVEYLYHSQKDTSFSINVNLVNGKVINDRGVKSEFSPIEYATKKAREMGITQVEVVGETRKLSDDSNQKISRNKDSNLIGNATDIGSLVNLEFNQLDELNNSQANNKHKTKNYFGTDNQLNGAAIKYGVKYSRNLLDLDKEKTIASIYSQETSKAKRVERVRNELKMDISHSSIYRIAKQYL